MQEEDINITEHHQDVSGKLLEECFNIKRGAASLERLKVFEGVPPPYDTRKK